jgi:hypothetical protein
MYDYWNLQQNIQSHYLHDYYAYYPTSMYMFPIINQQQPPQIPQQQKIPNRCTHLETKTNQNKEQTQIELYNYQNYGIYIPKQLQPKSGYKNLGLSEYSLWQNAHETQLQVDISNIMSDIILKNNAPVIKQKRIIDVSIHTIKDLIDLINNNPYEENVDYNIHLKELHLIKVDLEDLQNMIGMESVKQSILQQLLYFIQRLHINDILDSSGNKIDMSDFKHTVIMGPPGTGKTELAKIIGKIYSKIGILKNTIFKKVTRSELVAGYLGQTAIKTKKVIDECVGGVLFIDEAYSLGSDDSFSRECVDTLCEALSNYKKDLMVIIAGYEKDLNDKFFTMNSGLHSRFIWRFTIDAYKPDELMRIFYKKIKEQGWLYEDDAINKNWFFEKKEHFKHYGRDMELLWTYVKIMHAQRIYGKDISLQKKISFLDLEEGMTQFLKHMKKESVDSFRHRDSLYI